MIRIIAPGIVLGMMVLHQLATLPSRWWLLLLLLPFIFRLFFRRHTIVIFVSAFAIGFVWAYLHANWRLSAPLPESLYGQDITVRGFIASLPEVSERKQRFDFDITQVLQPANTLKKQRVRLSWYEHPEVALHAGQEWVLSIRLKPPRNFANPGMFNYTAWLYQNGIRYTGYVHAADEPRLLGHKSLSYPLQQFREAIRQQFKKHLRGYRFEPILRALIIGDRSDIAASSWDVLQQSGTVHLMAISGLHIGLIAGFVFVLARFLWSRFPACCLTLAAPRAAAIFAVLAALVYAALAGFSLPTQRALIMLTVVMLGLLFYRKISALDLLCVALLVVLIIDPLATLSASFWLSFTAVALIFFVLAVNKKHGSSLRHWLFLQIAISLGLLPLTVYFFQQAPLISPVANLIAIPVVTFLVIPAAMLGLIAFAINTELALMIFSWLDSVFAYLWQVLEWLTLLPYASFTMATPSLLVLCLAAIGIVLLVLPRVYGFQYLAVLLFVPLLFHQHERPTLGEANVTVLDVGQGLATVISTRSHTLVFDTGPKLGPQFDTGKAVVVPFLREQGVSHIDLLIVSHADNDHIGGAASVMALMPVAQLISSVPERFAGHASRRCEAGMHWTFDGVDFRVIYPQASDFDSGMSENNLSCVLQVTTQSKTFLLTADIETQAEQLLVGRYGKNLRSDVMVVPHHGSKTSSSVAFIAEVQPQVAIVPVGWRNRYRLPNDTVLARYQQSAIRLYATSNSGAIMIASQTGEIRTFREQNSRYWEQ